MYCPKCGTQLADNSSNCSSCDWCLPIAENKPEVTDSEEEFNNTEAFLNECSEMTIEEKNEDECSFLKEKEKNDKKPVEKDVGETNVGGSDNIPEAFVSVHSFKFDKRKIAVFTVAVVLISIFIGVMVYRNSDSYKIKKATEMIVLGNYSDGLNFIYDVYTPEATIIKNFVEVEIAKTNFVNIAATNGDREDAYAAYNEFASALNTFENENSSYILPAELVSDYNCYRTAFDFIDDFIYDAKTGYGEIGAALYGVQNIMMNKVERNDTSKYGESFTISTMKTRVDSTYDSLDVLEKYGYLEWVEIKDTEVLLYCKTKTVLDSDGTNITVVPTSKELYDIVKTLYNECYSEVYSEQLFINEILEDKEEDAELYMTSPDPDYTSYVGSSLNRISEVSDIRENRTIILNILETDMLYYMITGNTTTADN